MAEVFHIRRQDWGDGSPVTLTVFNDEEAETEHYDLEIEWDDEPVIFDEEGDGYVEGRQFALIYRDGKRFFAQKRHGSAERHSDESPFIALAQLAYDLGVSW